MTWWSMNAFFDVLITLCIFFFSLLISININNHPVDTAALARILGLLLLLLLLCISIHCSVHLFRQHS